MVPTVMLLVAGALRNTLSVGPVKELQGWPLERIPIPSQQLPLTTLKPELGVFDQATLEKVLLSRQMLQSKTQDDSALAVNSSAKAARDMAILFFISHSGNDKPQRILQSVGGVVLRCDLHINRLVEIPVRRFVDSGRLGL